MTPAQLGFRMPAEWEPHEATWVGWPHNITDWPGKIRTIHWVYGEIIRKLSVGERINILVNSKSQEAQARRVLARVAANISNIQFFMISTDRCWSRDFGPIFVVRIHPISELAIARFKFTAWAKYPDWKNDNQVSRKAATQLGYPSFRVIHKNRSVVLEGGSIDVNGAGTVLTTEECLLDPTVQVRNPGFGRLDYEQVFKDFLGAPNVVWLKNGIVGDDTHGHIDDICRFVDSKTVVLCQERNIHDENYRALADNLERLEQATLQDGSKLNVVPLPMPEPLYFEGRRLPASYANFYIGNAVVLVPTFNDPQDRIALGVLSELFVDRAVVGIHAVDLVWGFGTIHCLTQQQPVALGCSLNG